MGSLILCGMPTGSSASRAGVADAPRVSAGAQDAAQAGGASAERERGRALLRQGKAAEALIHLERALGQFQQSGDKAGEASALDLLGELYERQGRYDTALKHFDNAHKIYAAMALSERNQSNFVSALSTQEGAYNANLMLARIGEMHYRRGDIAKARAAFSRMRVTKPETDMLKAAQGGKSSAESKASKITGFGSRMRGVLSGRPTASTPGAAANVLNDTTSAFKAPFNAYRETVIYATHELGLGRVDYFNDQLDPAKKHFENVLAATLGNLPVVGKLGQTRRYRTAARTSLGDIAFRQARYADAVKLYNEASKGAREDARLDLAWPAQRGTGRSLWAQAALEKDEKKALKMREDALAAYREALATIETIRRGSLRADEARTTFLATTEEVFDEASAALAEMALGAGPGASVDLAAAAQASAPLEGRSLEYAAEALSVVEQGRARSLLDMLSETGAEITEGVPSDLLQRKQENQARQEEMAAHLTGVNLGGDAQKKSLDELEAELGRLQTEFESIENQIRSASPRYAALTAAAPLTLADIRQKVLDEETALLEYSLGDERSYLYAVTRGGMTLSRLPARAEVERQAVALRQQIIPASLRRALTDTVAAANDPQRGLAVSTGGGQATPAAVAAYASAAHALYKTAVEPAAPLFKASRLLVVADGALNYVPFHALVTSAPAAGADYTTLAYLLKTNETIFAPSASVVAAIRQQRAGAEGGGASRSNGMLLVADPVFDARDARVRASKPAAAAAPQGAQGSEDASRALSVESALNDVSGRDSAGGPPASVGGQGGVLVRLAGTREEAQQIARLAAASGRKADTWLDLDANESNIEERDLRQYRVLHFATHGLLNAERPQFTGVVLSLVGNDGASDGFLRTDEIFNLRLASPLVMLSACETGLGREKRGEGVIGLTRAFMYAGAPAVGVSLWSVADKSTAELMTDFYKNLFGGAGTTPTAAMRAARRNMIAGKKYSAPFYWAPFVINGDWHSQPAAPSGTVRP